VNDCIYCSKPAGSLEHVVPAAFGEFEGAPNLQNYLCEDCNRTLGLLDEQLSRCSPEALVRSLQGIKGRKAHDKINPFARGSAGGNRIKVTSFDKEAGIEVNLELVNGEARQLCEILIIDSETHEVKHLPLRENMTPEQLRDELYRLDTSPLSEKRVSVGRDEQEWVEKLIKRAWPTAELTGTKVMSNTYEGFKAEFGLTDRYFRAIAKIGFHYFLTQFTKYRGDEPMFSNLRKFIQLDGSQLRINEFIKVWEMKASRRKTNHDPIDKNWSPDHFLVAGMKPGEFYAQVQLHLSERLPNRFFRIRLSSYTTVLADHATAHGYRYFREGKKGRFSGEARQLRPSPMSYKPNTFPKE
jgi:hypothetical protein